MDNQTNSQGNTSLDHNLVFLAMRQRGIIQKKVAKALNCTQGAISQALNGENPGLLERIDRFIKRYDRQKTKNSERKDRGAAA
ncbi:MAG TPA: hypothetical protein VHO03_05730 [Ignavibacteriales bacterium]|nr:hypothetical protein [Ignavibacteriales bacterium]